MYSRVPADTKREIVSWFTTLCQDVTPMVRRSAANALKDLIDTADDRVMVDNLLPLAQLLFKDDQVGSLEVGVKRHVSLIANGCLVFFKTGLGASDRRWPLRGHCQAHGRRRRPGCRHAHLPLCGCRALWVRLKNDRDLGRCLIHLRLV